ncbi:MAG: GTPase ObgE [Candidatus Kerfeldbacteria bacterium]|nr:GTPase ObgE [Candidatus Kerfeldbacteria bacterium]
MAFVDELTIQLTAGNGGSGVVRWRREKFVAKGGPAGGNGGQGGDVYLESVSDLTILARYRGQKEFRAADGNDGGSALKHGRDGEDLVLKVPSGSFVTNSQTGETYDLTASGQRVRLLRGGGGGRGNFAFRSASNVAPQAATQGGQGEQGTFRIELRLVVDVGLIGLPNAGKSSLLNELTKARARVGEYPFTTLEPNLGMLDGLVVADIPGLIAGASKGKGLGIKFLRHIERTKLIAHCLSLEHLNLMKAYKVVRKELEDYGRNLSIKPEIIILTKTDIVTAAVLQEAQQAFKNSGYDVFSCSIFDLASIEELSQKLQTSAPQT